MAVPKTIYLLTDSKIAKLNPRAKPFEVRDGDGLGVVIRPNGGKSFCFRFKFGGASRNLTLGPASLSIEAARKLAAAARIALAEGRDPCADKRARRESAKVAVAAARAAKHKPRNSVGEVVAAFLADERRRGRAKPKTVAGAARLLERNLAEWRDRPIADISRADVAALIHRIAERAPVQANRLLAALRRLFAFAVVEEIIARNPTDGIAAPTGEVARARVLSPNEIAAVWRASDRVSGEVAPFIRLLILTGSRFSEVAKASWSEFDLEAAVWTLPAARAKNGRAHIVPLSAAAMRVIAPMFEIRRDDGRLFASSFSRVRDKIDATIGEVDGVTLSHWTPHDIRRTFATLLQQLGTPIHVTEACLNHKSGAIRGVAAIYQRFDYLPERREALEKLGAHVDMLTVGNVVALPVRAAL
jgi:integrase